MVLLRQLFQDEIQLSPLQTIKILQDKGLLTKEMNCLKCNSQMYLSESDNTDGYKWRCKVCKTSKTVRTNSWFSNSHLSMHKILQLTYMWTYHFEQKHVIRELEISAPTVVDWFNFCREICTEIVLNRSTEKIGGINKIVEIDEAKFGKRKYNRGKHVEGQWVFGGVERGTNKCFLIAVNNRSANTLIPIIKEFIQPGTTIYSDCWKAYDQLGQENYEHLTVNHSLTFKDPETGACTNTIEGLWATVKRFLPGTNRKKDLFCSYLSQFMYMHMYKDVPCMYEQFLKDVAVIYPPLNS